ncbi:hypothetical protein [Aquimarina brevivitae]|uniref:Uncharacterized protein n=1 Tax=Aquimarina brevivitae TaxID=323412 RepID=A0A4Q7PH51_9FLAO|nr:hypothetical protein [Aquimarina brevivitae]RZS99715.1 hypothetical protein EV197_0939 [Aquimarina brevivitae]
MFFKVNELMVFTFITMFFYASIPSTLNAQVIAAPSIKTKAEKLDLSDFQGSPYLKEEYQQAMIYDAITGQNRNAFIRYNVLDDVFEIKSSKTANVVEELKKSYEIHVEFDNRKFYYRNYTDEGEKAVTGYLEQLGTSENNDFYIKYAKELRMPQKAQTSLEQDRPGKIRDQSYYLTGTGNAIKPSDIDKRNILNFFPKAQKAKLKEYIKEQRLKFRDAEDIKKLVVYFNSL